MGGSAESYLVRIYRRDVREPRRVTGLVEIIERERTETFKSADELLEILGIDLRGDGRSERNSENAPSGEDQ